MDSIKEIVCKNITYLRKQQGKTQQEIADFLGGMTRSNYSKLERGETYLSIDRAFMLAKLFHISLDELTTVDLETHIKETPAMQDESEAYFVHESDKPFITISIPLNMLEDRSLDKSYNDLLAVIKDKSSKKSRNEG